MPAVPNRFERVRRELVFFPVPDDWMPDTDEKMWLEDLDAMSDDELRQLDRFCWTPGDRLEVTPPE